ncbi:hypothetical protein BP5796_05526 [Coleophoma crateriformis]|uniref:DNA polymerase delta subunit 3 n=1 Tax=Coleophoma crateriformis TaxID=565419 RepID=A0A3D8S3H6_9HELO|nr:hypothetical protein BP5796_05526 [Coleophoma crateriformis]
MLFEFHRQQNGKKPGTIYATYLVGGIKRADEKAVIGSAKKDGEDEYMQSSPFMSSSMPQPDDVVRATSTFTVSLTGEENLDNLYSQYESITSVHVYSIGPQPIKDLQILADATREVQQVEIGNDPLASLSSYGTIINKDVRRRTGKPKLQQVPAAIPVKSAPATSKLSAATSNPVPETKPQISSAAKDFFAKGPAKVESTVKSETTEPKPPPTLKKESSSIFKSFAKAKPKLKREETDSSAAQSPRESAPASGVEDEPMRDVSEDEEETWVPPPKTNSNDIVDKDRKSRKEREAKLKQMMEEDDADDMVDTPTTKVEEDDDKETEQTEANPEATTEAPPVSGDRRRGRRRVIKKKTIKDDEGYLVTKEEAVWESFSEDEAVALKTKGSNAASTALKPKKVAAKTGQGSIMSFFGKK